MYSMKEACQQTGMTYENLKFYCNEGLVPNVKRDSRNYRIFDEHDINSILQQSCTGAYERFRINCKKRFPSGSRFCIFR